MESGVVNPLTLYPRGGYPLIAGIDKYRSIWATMQPGANGTGLHLGAVMPTCCTMSYGRGYNACVTDDGGLWTQPVSVQYVSILSPKTLMPYNDIAELFPHVVGPHLAVVDANTMLDTYNWFVSGNLLRPESDEYVCDYFESFDTSVGPIKGLIPAWEFVQLGDEDNANVINALSRAWHDVYAMDSCYCSLEDYGDHTLPNYEDRHINAHPNGMAKSTCTYSYGASTCSCGEQPTAEQRFDSFWYEMPNLSDDSAISPFADYCAQQSAEGWAKMYTSLSSTTSDLEDECFTSYWRLHSPYVDLRLLNKQLQQQFSHSTDSATPQAYSHAS